MRIHQIFITSVLLFTSLLGCSISKPVTEQLTGESISIVSNETRTSIIDSLLNNKLLDAAFVGIKVVNLTKNETIYEKNPNKLFRPASNMKLITTGAAIELMSADFYFKTELITDGEIVDSILNGNLYLKGYGDPLLQTGDLDSLLNYLFTKKIKRIKGNLIGDVSFFDDNYWGKGWMWDDEPEPFAAFITPLTINGNSVKIFVTPGAKIGETVKVTIEPETEYVHIINSAITSAINDTAIEKLSVIRNRKERNNIITVSGYIPLDSKGKEFAVSVWKPELFTLQLLRKKLEQSNIKIEGTVLIDTISRGKPVAAIDRPIDSVLSEINKNSNNMASENLLKTLSAEILKTRGNSEASISLVNKFLSSIEIDTNKIVIADGSGVSRYNLLSSNAVVKLLSYYHRNQKYNRFYSTLSIAGVDGTLKNRFQTGNVKNNFRGKTGTHSDALSLSGYLRNSNNDTLAFSIFFNNVLPDFYTKLKDYRDIQDAIVEVLAK
ncbi:MAG: D-alanyl-D-alanine carboxypeptidase/D-alanyl-D-alanine-endopeptidase [Bacteroidota bacterium]|nr:D-alanyl-D-alanine carboxypeptidase/D-alanyl-D-alanine-endopeptidase [Bacteroidota bacterium]